MSQDELSDFSSFAGVWAGAVSPAASARCASSGMFDFCSKEHTHNINTPKVLRKLLWSVREGTYEGSLHGRVNLLRGRGGTLRVGHCGRAVHLAVLRYRLGVLQQSGGNTCERYVRKDAEAGDVPRPPLLARPSANRQPVNYSTDTFITQGRTRRTTACAVELSTSAGVGAGSSSAFDSGSGSFGAAAGSGMWLMPGFARGCSEACFAFSFDVDVRRYAICERRRADASAMARVGTEIAPCVSVTYHGAKYERRTNLFRRVRTRDVRSRAQAKRTIQGMSPLSFAACAAPLLANRRGAAGRAGTRAAGRNERARARCARREDIIVKQ